MRNPPRRLFEEIVGYRRRICVGGGFSVWEETRQGGLATRLWRGLVADFAAAAFARSSVVVAAAGGVVEARRRDKRREEKVSSRRRLGALRGESPRCGGRAVRGASRRGPRVGGDFPRQIFQVSGKVKIGWRQEALRGTGENGVDVKSGVDNFAGIA